MKSRGIVAHGMKKGVSIISSTFLLLYQIGYFHFLLYSQILLQNVVPIIFFAFQFLSFTLALLVKSLTYPKCKQSEVTFWWPLHAFELYVLVSLGRQCPGQQAKSYSHLSFPIEHFSMLTPG